MKFKLCLIALSFCFISSVVYSVQKSPHNLNAEPVEGTQGRYFPAIKFKSIDSVSVSTMLPAESLGRKRETIILPRNQLIYDDKTGLIEVKRKIDNSAYIVRAEGKFETPLCVMVTGGEKASNIRFVCNGKIGKAGTDYS